MHTKTQCCVISKISGPSRGWGWGKIERGPDSIWSRKRKRRRARGPSEGRRRRGPFSTTTEMTKQFQIQEGVAPRWKFPVPGEYCKEGRREGRRRELWKGKMGKAFRVSFRNDGNNICTRSITLWASHKASIRKYCKSSFPFASKTFRGKHICRAS